MEVVDSGGCYNEWGKLIEVRGDWRPSGEGMGVDWWMQIRMMCVVLDQKIIVTIIADIPSHTFTVAQSRTA